MATIRLVPSTYYLSSSTYLSVSNATNMYENTDSDTYATVTNSQTGTTSYYIYIRGFNFNSIPSNAIINSWSVKLKARESGITTSSSYSPKLCHGTSQITSTCSAISTTVTTYTFTGVSESWESIYEYGSDFGIRINCRRASRNTTGYMYIYGAEIEVDYTIPVYHRVTAVSEVEGVTVSPLAEDVMEGTSYEILIEPGSVDISTLTLTDNETDVTSQIVEHIVSGGTIERYPASYTTSGSISGTNYTYCIGKGSDTASSSGNDYASSSGSTAHIDYSFDFSDIPENAVIESMSMTVKGHCESTSSSSEVATLRLYSGNTAKGSESEFTSTSDTVVTMTTGTWTVEELKDAKLRFTIGYYGGKVVGATWEVTYSVETSVYYTYTINNVTADHDVVVSLSGPYVPPEEDPTKTYHSLTISSINASIEPVNGTTRVEAGTTQVVTITPTDPKLTLALDNGVDITSQLVGGVPTNTYTIDTQVSGASYGFNLNSSTGYYVSTNKGVSKSASVARLNMNFESDCLVTITYINYAEENYDYGMFGKLDTEVATDGLTASSGGSNPSDSTSNYELARCSNSTSTQTITYQVPSGEHFIDIKYGKDDASNAGNDSLQWKVTSVEATGTGGDYTYTLTNINQKHSLIFVFGDVDYYFVTSSTSSSNVRLFPDGQTVKLSGYDYRLVIVPNESTYTVTLSDNNTDVTSRLTREEGTDKSGGTVVNYIYELTNITATHTLVVGCSGGTTQTLYLKSNDRWVAVSKAYIKQNGTWVEQSDLSQVFNSTTNYKKNS